MCEGKTQLGDLTITADTLSLQMVVRQVTQPWRRRMLGALAAVGLAQGWNGTLVRDASSQWNFTGYGNVTELVLGCIETKFCKKICV